MRALDGPETAAASRPTACLALGGLMTLGALLLFPGLGAAPLERAEIYFLDAARSMLERGDWLVPHYRGEPFWDKPALTYWLMAACFHVFGFTLAAGRLAPALAALLTLPATYWVGVRTVGRRAALAGTLALATTPAFLGVGRLAMSDALLALCCTASLGLGLAAYAGRAAWAVPGLGLALGAGFLVKGPIALVLPGLALAALAVVRWRGEGTRPPLTPAGLTVAGLLFVVSGLGWFVLVQRRVGHEPLAWFFLRENLQRFATATYDVGRPPWYYLGAYLGLGAPWSLFMPLALLRILKPRAERGAPEQGARLLGLWLGLMLLPLGLSRGKIDYYLLPLLPPASLLIGWLLVGVPWARLERGWARGVSTLTALLATLLLLVPSRVPWAWLPSESGLGLALAGHLAALVLLAIATLRATQGLTLGGLAAASSLLFLAASALFVPSFRAGQPNERIVADVLRERAYEPRAQLALCRDPVRVQRDLLFATRSAPEERCDLDVLLASERPLLLLLDQDELGLARRPGLRPVASYRYLPARLFTLRGLLEGATPRAAALYASYASRDPIAVRQARRERRRAIRARREAVE
jgi:4-amino-4-deoxy-L-arabinose transferase-like glycosyltransferase